MRARWLVLGAVGLLIAGLAGPSLMAEQIIGATAVTPASVPAGVGTSVKVTAVIDDSSLITPSVNLQRLDSAGRVLQTLGALVDDGTNGDTVAGDKTFTMQITIFESNPGPVRLRVSAAFLGKLTRAFSPPMTVNVTGGATGIAMASPGHFENLNTTPVRIIGTIDVGTDIRAVLTAGPLTH